MEKKLFILGLVVAFVVSLAGCASSGPSAGDADSVLPSDPPSSSEAPPQESVPKEPESEPLSSEPEAEVPKEKAISIYLHQDQLTFNGPTPVWELTIEDEEELALVESLLSGEGLTPSSEEYAMFPDGGTGISFAISYEDRTLRGSCNPQYIDAPYNRERDASTYYSEEVFYDYPRAFCEQLLAFLEGKGITVGG